jgi:hypothetical protein
MEEKVDVDAVLDALDGRFAMHGDTLAFYKEFFYENPDRIYLPDDDYTFFDPVFRVFERAAREGKTARIVHYGDSQIEMDRISMNLREALQHRFGGCGTGMFPAMTNTPMASVSRSASGGFVSYTMFGDSTTRRAGHKRYGPLAQVTGFNGNGTVSIRARREKSTPDHVRYFQSVSVLYGRASDNFTVTAQSDTIRPKPVVRTKGGLTWATWNFRKPVEKATLKVSGQRRDLRRLHRRNGRHHRGQRPAAGQHGHDSHQYRQGPHEVVLRVGQHPAHHSAVRRKLRPRGEVFQGHFRLHGQGPGANRLVPGGGAPGEILFIGPSDMAVSTEDGRIVSYRRLPELVDSLKAVSLKSGAAYWDLYRMMGGQNSMTQWVRHRPPYAGPDYIHFTPAGAKVVGETLSRSFLTYYDFYDLRKSVPKSAVQQTMGR